VIGALGAAQITAASATSTGLLAAGLKPDGSLTGSSALAITVTGMAALAGINAASGTLTLQAGRIDVSASHTYAGNTLALLASAGDLNATGATLSAGGAAGFGASGKATFDQAVVLADQLAITAASLSNAGGTLQQSGTGAGAISIAGLLDNSNGSIVSNGALTVAAAEAAVGLAILVVYFRNRGEIATEDVNVLRG
jgi:filamentous hemagglutinin